MAVAHASSRLDIVSTPAIAREFIQAVKHVSLAAYAVPHGSHFVSWQDGRASLSLYQSPLLELLAAKQPPPSPKHGAVLDFGSCESSCHTLRSLACQVEPIKSTPVVIV